MAELSEIFNQLKPVLSDYSPPLFAKRDEDGYFDLWSIRDLVIDGRRHKEIYFAALVIHKSYVGFYFMPIYVDSELKGVLAPELLKILKGKSCFHIKELTPSLLEQVKAVIATGFALYQKRGWA